MSAIPQLVNKYNRYQNRRVRAAVRLLREDFITDPGIPEDTGDLRRKFRLKNATYSAPRYSVIAEARAFGDEGADYAAILEHAPRIQPKKAKYLRFVVGGNVVFSKGFDNKHYQWWSKWWAQSPSPWRTALISAANEVKY